MDSTCGGKVDASLECNPTEGEADGSNCGLEVRVRECRASI